MLHGAELGPQPSRLEDRASRERDDDGVGREEPHRPGDDVVAAVEPGALQLGHDADSPGGQLEHLLEGRDPELPQLDQRACPERPAGGGEPVEPEVVEDDEPAVARGLDVELDVVGADLDRALERGEGVLELVVRRAAVGDDDHARSRSSS